MLPDTQRFGGSGGDQLILHPLFEHLLAALGDYAVTALEGVQRIEGHAADRDEKAGASQRCDGNLYRFEFHGELTKPSW